VHLASTGYLPGASCHSRPAPGGKQPARFGVDSSLVAVLDSNPGLVSRQAREFPKTMNSSILSLLLGCACLVPAPGNAQVNSGSDGHDGAFNPTQSVEIDMADHPDGIYHLTTVTVPAGVTVTFKPNAKNTPVVWLAQGDCVIDGTVDVAGKDAVGAVGGNAGPGGWRGGSGVNPNAQAGEGPGGGHSGTTIYVRSGYSGWYQIDQAPGAGSYGTAGYSAPPEKIYGNPYVLPLMGGSGAGGYYYNFIGDVSLFGGGGGGGAVLIASPGSVVLNGSINAFGGNEGRGIGGGSGGGVRIVTSCFRGSGKIDANGRAAGGAGRIRIDAMQSTFGGTFGGSVTQGFQPIIIPAAGQGVQLSIASIAGTAISQSPSGVLVNPDVIIPAQQGAGQIYSRSDDFLVLRIFLLLWYM